MMMNLSETTTVLRKANAESAADVVPNIGTKRVSQFSLPISVDVHAQTMSLFLFLNVRKALSYYLKGITPLYTYMAAVHWAHCAQLARHIFQDAAHTFAIAHVLLDGFLYWHISASCLSSSPFSRFLFPSLLFKETVDAIGIKGLLAVPIWAGLVALPLAMTVGGMVRVEAVKCHIYIYFWSRKCDFTHSLPSTYLLSSLRLTLVYAFIMCGIAGGNFPGRMEAECLGSSRVVRFNLLAVCKYEEYIIIIQATIKNTSKKEERKRLLVGYVLHITHICYQRFQSPSPQSQPLNRLLFRSSWFYCVISTFFLPFRQTFSPSYPFYPFHFVFLPGTLPLPRRDQTTYTGSRKTGRGRLGCV